jgi:hypothetical protein
MDTINQRTLSFIEYLVLKDLSPKEAYLTVYKDCKPESAESSASRLLANDKVSEAVEEMRADKRNKLLKTEEIEENYKPAWSKHELSKARHSLFNEETCPHSVRAKLLDDEAKMNGYNEPDEEQGESVRVIMWGSQETNHDSKPKPLTQAEQASDQSIDLD